MTSADNRRNLMTSSVNLPAAVWGTDKQASLTRLDRWLESAQRLVNENYARNFPNLVPSLLEMSDGRRYIRIDAINHGGAGQRSVWAFIDKKTGGILKPAGYKAPAKHERGNLFDAFNGMKFVTAYGPAYLR